MIQLFSKKEAFIAALYQVQAAIDARIRDIEFKMQHESLNLKDEKAYMKEIAELKKNKPKLSQFSQLTNKLDNFDAGTDLQAKKRELNEVRARDAHGARTHGARPVRVACGARVSAVPKVLSQLKTQPIWM